MGATMSIDIKMLLWSAALTLLQMLVAVIGAQLQVGLPPLIGNRENLPTMVGWAGRAQRAHHNMMESVVVFAILVLVANATGKANATTALGSELFFWSRLVYALIYWIGIPWVRTAAWGVSIVGLVLIFIQLI
jgi:uncharacterized MAPEG superfamily protein